MTRVDMFEAALAHTLAIGGESRGNPALQSIVDQLRFLIAWELGQTRDLDKLDRINIDVLAAREVEDIDLNVANELYQVTSEVAKMKAEAAR